jgi:hypothetical protein
MKYKKVLRSYTTNTHHTNDHTHHQTSLGENLSSRGGEIFHSDFIISTLDQYFFAVKQSIKKIISTDVSKTKKGKIGYLKELSSALFGLGMAAYQHKDYETAAKAFELIGPGFATLGMPYINRINERFPGIIGGIPMHNKEILEQYKIENDIGKRYQKKKLITF